MVPPQKYPQIPFLSQRFPKAFKSEKGLIDGLYYTVVNRRLEIRMLCLTPAKRCYVSTYQNYAAYSWFDPVSLIFGDASLRLLAGGCLVHKGNLRTQPVRTAIKKAYDQE
jgi:hypothetical protein